MEDLIKKLENIVLLLNAYVENGIELNLNDISNQIDYDFCYHGCPIEIEEYINYVKGIIFGLNYIDENCVEELEDIPNIEDYNLTIDLISEYKSWTQIGSLENLTYSNNTIKLLNLEKINKPFIIGFFHTFYVYFYKTKYKFLKQ